MTLNFMKPRRSTDEIEEENQRLDAEISLRQKRLILKRLDEQGLSLKNFGGSLLAAFRWLKSRKKTQ